MLDPETCKHCARLIIMSDGVWVDPQASGDDGVWREVCDQHDTFQAEHEPEGIAGLLPTALSSEPAAIILTTWTLMVEAVANEEPVPDAVFYADDTDLVEDHTALLLSPELWRYIREELS